MKDEELTLEYGYMMWFEGRGAFAADIGRVEGYTKEDCDRQNQLLDESLLKGLETRCEVGMGSPLPFYVSEQDANGFYQIKTFGGQVVSATRIMPNQPVRFGYKGMAFKAAWRDRDNDMSIYPVRVA